MNPITPEEQVEAWKKVILEYEKKCCALEEKCLKLTTEVARMKNGIPWAIKAVELLIEFDPPVSAPVRSLAFSVLQTLDAIRREINR